MRGSDENLRQWEERGRIWKLWVRTQFSKQQTRQNIRDRKTEPGGMASLCKHPALGQHPSWASVTGRANSNRADVNSNQVPRSLQRSRAAERGQRGPLLSEKAPWWGHLAVAIIIHHDFTSLFTLLGLTDISAAGETC